MTPIKTAINPDHVSELSIDGFSGRILHLPAKSKSSTTTVFVYGSRATLERNYGIAERLASVTNVVFPDLPGFGGMNSFFSVGSKPTFANMGDYLAKVITQECGTGRLNIVGFSQGFPIVTHLLANYPEIAERVDTVVSLAGPAAGSNSVFSSSTSPFYRLGLKAVSTAFGSYLYRHTLISGWWLRRNYKKSKFARSKFEGFSEEQQNELMEIEVYLWHLSDTRTWAYANLETLRFDQTIYRINKPVHYIRMKDDQFFDPDKVIASLGIIYDEVKISKASLHNHSPTVIDSAEVAAELIPDEILEAL